MPDLVGQSPKSRYLVKELIGRGSMAKVCRAFDLRCSRLVAIKIMRADLAEEPEFVERFRQEARNLNRLVHDVLVRLYEFAHGLPAERQVWRIAN